MESTPNDSAQIPCDSGQRDNLPHIYDNVGFLEFCNSSHITCITGTTHTSSQPCQDKFDTDGVSIVSDNRRYITMSHFKHEFVGPLKKRTVHYQWI